MKLLPQSEKKKMEYCKSVALANGLSFDKNTLEYIVTNMDMIELSPKVGIPTLYDFWVDDIEIFQGKRKYELYPHNPYETVVNTRPAISYYNVNNPDWLNKMIYYHVLGHIDFFQNNRFFSHTWHDDFTAKALSDRRTVETLRRTFGHKVDYVIEAARSLDNIVDYFAILDAEALPAPIRNKVDFFFDVFLAARFPGDENHYRSWLNRLNKSRRRNAEQGDELFVSEITREWGEFEREYNTWQPRRDISGDLLEFLSQHSPLIEKRENTWYRDILQVVRETSLYFSPQIRTKIMNEGWASYWHEKLFLQDEDIRGRGSNFAITNAGVLGLTMGHLNPYAIGFRLFHHIRDKADKGHYSLAFDRVTKVHERQNYDQATGRGDAFIFDIRSQYSDFAFINEFIDQDFVDRYQLYVLGEQQNPDNGHIEYYIKSRDANDYKAMLIDSLYERPAMRVDLDATSRDGMLHIVHEIEQKELVKQFIPNVLFYADYLWGQGVVLKTGEFVLNNDGDVQDVKPVYYTYSNGKMEKREG